MTTRAYGKSDEQKQLSLSLRPGKTQTDTACTHLCSLPASFSLEESCDIVTIFNSTLFRPPR